MRERSTRMTLPLEVAMKAIARILLPVVAVAAFATFAGFAAAEEEVEDGA